jgi:hypothetical protein
VQGPVQDASPSLSRRPAASGAHTYLLRVACNMACLPCLQDVQRSRDTAARRTQINVHTATPGTRAAAPAPCSAISIAYTLCRRGVWPSGRIRPVSVVAIMTMHLTEATSRLPRGSRPFGCRPHRRLRTISCSAKLAGDTHDCAGTTSVEQPGPQAAAVAGVGARPAANQLLGTLMSVHQSVQATEDPPHQ